MTTRYFRGGRDEPPATFPSAEVELRRRSRGCVDAERSLRTKDMAASGESVTLSRRTCGKTEAEQPHAQFDLVGFRLVRVSSSVTFSARGRRLRHRGTPFPLGWCLGVELGRRVRARHVRDEIHHPARVPPLVIVPRQHFDEILVY